MTASQARNNIRYIEPPSALPDSEQTIVSDQSFFMILPRQLGGFSRNGERGGTGPILGRLPWCVGQAEGQVVIEVDPDTSWGAAHLGGHRRRCRDVAMEGFPVVPDRRPASVGRRGPVTVHVCLCHPARDDCVNAAGGPSDRQLREVARAEMPRPHYTGRSSTLKACVGFTRKFDHDLHNVKQRRQVLGSAHNRHIVTVVTDTQVRQGNEDWAKVGERTVALFQASAIHPWQRAYRISLRPLIEPVLKVGTVTSAWPTWARYSS